MLWVKAFHIVFVVSWFAGLFYLPRIFVNLAMAKETAEYDRLTLMARKLYRFTHPLMGLTLALGFWLWLGYGIGKGQGWMHAKMLVVALLVAYQIFCGRILKSFEARKNLRSHRFYRVFNELPVLALVVAVVLVILKPF
jgi:protoporphyrinogen IX oxidase